MNTIIDLFTSGGFGAIIGTFGSWLTKREERQTLQMQWDHEFRINEFNASHALNKDESKRETIVIQGDIEVEKTETLAFKDSLKVAAINTGSVFVDGVRGLMRPTITVFLLVKNTLLALKIHALVGGLQNLSETQLFELYQNIIMQLLFLTSTAVTWWFSSRPQKRYI
jgi:hypothetical protein